MVRLVPSEIFKLKKWLTLPDASKHLSDVCGEEVTEADILGFALDGYLKLSVYFKNTVYVTQGYLEKDTLIKELLEKVAVPEQMLKSIEQISNCFNDIPSWRAKRIV